MFDYTYLFSQPLVRHGYKGFLDSSAKVRTVLFTCSFAAFYQYGVRLLIEILTYAFPKVASYRVSIYESSSGVPHRVRKQDKNIL